MNRLPFYTATAAILLSAGVAAQADNLYRGTNWPALSGDRKASAVGDALTVVIFQAAEATNTAQNNSRKKTDLGGSISAGSLDERGSLEFGGGYTGRGEVRRSEKLVAQITVVVREVLPNGDFVVTGEQVMRVNGETTRIGVRGRVRFADVTADNTILSSRIADAQISYDGRGFVSRSAKPGLLNRVFNFLGLG
jgi:flagellar L-ring protein precursor FlgH